MAFFFTFKIEGQGCPVSEGKGGKLIKNSSTKIADATSPLKMTKTNSNGKEVNSPSSGTKDKQSKDPISVSFKERKDAGSILSLAQKVNID